jgi:hypothetical protein
MNDTSLTPLTATKNPAIAGVGYLIVGVINLPMNQLVVSQTTGGLGRNYNFTNSTVPAGLRIDSTTNGTATLAGTPTVTSLTPTSYTVTANQTPDIPNQTATPSTITYSLAIASTLTSAYNDVPQGTTRWLPPNTTITSFIPIQASGGWTPYKYTLTYNTLPSGLSYSETTGTITGSNGATNLLTFNVNIEDSSNAPKQPTTSKQFNMRVATVKATTVDFDNRIFVRGIPISPFRPITYTSTAPTASYTMTGDNDVSMNSSTGIISGTPTAVQASKAYTVTIRDVCQPFQEISTPFNMGFCEVLTTSGNVSANRYVAINDTITSFTPVTHTGGADPVTKILSPSSPALRGTLTLNATSGLLTGVAPSTVDSSMITYTIRTTDSSTGSTVVPTRQNVDNTFKLQVVSTLVASQNVPSRVILINTSTNSLSYFPITAGNTGSPIKTYVIKPGTTALPAGTGFQLSTSGQIIGTPTVATNPQTLITYTVKVTDECLPQQSKENTFTLGIAPTLTVSITTPIIYIKVSTATTFQAVTIAGGWLPLSVTPSVALPGTLTIAQDRTGVVTGTAGASVNTTTLTFTVVDTTSAPQTQTKTTTTSLSLRTVAALIGGSANVSRIFAVGVPIVEFAPLTGVAGGGGTRTYDTTTALPPGLSFSLVNNGFITGTPTTIRANTTYNVTVTDQTTPVQTLGISPNPLLTTSMQVVGALVLTTNPSIPVLTEGVAFTTFTPVSVTGGTSTKVFSISPSLPNGLVFNTSNGQITGSTPTITGVRSSQEYTVRVIDQCTVPQDKTATFTLTVRAAAQRIFEPTPVPNAADTTFVYSWVVPAGVTSISIVCVGGGGGAGASVSVGGSTYAGGAGGGGALAYTNNIAVTPGSTITVTAGGGGASAGSGGPGGAGGTSSVVVGGTTVCAATGGRGGLSGSTGTGGNGGTVVAGTGGAGGKGGNAVASVNASFGGAGGGGAGGYAGAGGAGGNALSGGGSPLLSGQNGSGGAGGGGSGGNFYINGGGGGGVGLLGQGSDGAGGTGLVTTIPILPSGNGRALGGTGGSGGNTGGSGFPHNGGTGYVITTPYYLGGQYGGGTGGTGTSLYGSSGAVRIMWPGNTRQYPSTSVADQIF